MSTRPLAVLIVAAALAGCGAPAAPATPPATTGPASGAGGSAPLVLRVAELDGFSPLVTSGDGRTVYRFDRDSSNPPASRCTSACLRMWEPVLAPDGFQVEGGIEPEMVGTVTRPGGGEQLTLDGWPMYHFRDDLKLGQTAGHGVANVWFAMAPRGGRAEQAAAPAQPGTSGRPQVLRMANLTRFSPIVVNGTGRTVYRYDRDRTNPPKSACTGECLERWEPVLAPDGVQIDATLDASLVGVITRPDGAQQLTLDSRPLYYFRTDRKLGQTAGHGVGDDWFAVSPDGSRAKRVAS
jgi:predicted lipoprotein with Yx(FWY)xxD motif